MRTATLAIIATMFLFSTGCEKKPIEYHWLLEIEQDGKPMRVLTGPDKLFSQWGFAPEAIVMPLTTEEARQSITVHTNTKRKATITHNPQGDTLIVQQPDGDMIAGYVSTERLYSATFSPDADSIAFIEGTKGITIGTSPKRGDMTFRIMTRMMPRWDAETTNLVWSDKNILTAEDGHSRIWNLDLRTNQWDYWGKGTTLRKAPQGFAFMRDDRIGIYNTTTEVVHWVSEPKIHTKQEAATLGFLVSPTGLYVAWDVTDKDKTDLIIQRLSSYERTRVPGTTGITRIRSWRNNNGQWISKDGVTAFRREEMKEEDQ